ncbi:MAG: DUF2914 domain-containing protein [Methylococcales bacterium]|nr:DUF2914 domain-containing protein [Methylococcales bacterium]
MTQSAQTKWWPTILVLLVIVGLWGYRQQLQPKPMLEIEREQMINASHLAAGFQAGMMMKVAVAQYYSMNGEMPDSNEAVRLGKPEVYADQSLKSATIKTGGIIQLTYDIKSGIEDGVIQFIPSVVPGLLKWSCETSDYVAIYRFMPQCKYMPTVGNELIISAESGKSSTEIVASSCSLKNLPMLLKGIFTRQVINDQAVDNLDSLGIHQQELYFHNMIIGGIGQKVTHRWLLNDQPTTEQHFTLGADQLAIWSKQLLTDKQGSWEVQVWTQGCLLDKFSIAHANNEQAQVLGIDKSHSWHKPKDVLDSLIIDSAKVLLPVHNYKSEYWKQWEQADDFSGWDEIKVGSIINGEDDISAFIRLGEIEKIKDAISKANIHRLNSQGERPFFEAIKYQQQEIALLLLKTGSNPFMHTAKGEKPYTLAVENGMTLVTEAILKYAEHEEKLWLQGKNKQFGTIIINSIMAHQKWQQRNILGDTPLLLATRLDNDWAVAVLLQTARKRGDVLNAFMSNHMGKRANEIARDNNNLLAADLIERFQAKSKAPWFILESAISHGLKGDRPLDCIEKDAVSKSATYYYFNHLMDYPTDNLRHMWFYKGRFVKELKPNYGSNNNILFSSHTLTEVDKGHWYVELVNKQDKVLDRMALAYGERYTLSSTTPLAGNCYGSASKLETLITGWQDPKLVAKILDEMDDFNPERPKGMAEAVESGNISAVRLLLARGVDLATPLYTKSSAYPKPALFLAVDHNKPIMVKYLLHRGADVNQLQPPAALALMRAVTNQNHPIIKILLEASAIPTILLNYYDNSPLIKAANFCDLKAMSMLTEYGASFAQKTKKGMTALKMANKTCRNSADWQQIKALLDQSIIVDK